MKTSVKQSIKSNMTVPNALTALRIIIIYPLTRFLLQQNYIMAGVMILLSAFTDMMDGFIARKFNQVSNLGKILDPIADKLTLISVVICVNVLYPDIRMFTIVLVIKELLMLSGGAVLLKLRIRPPAARWYGKLSTIIFYTCVTTLILLRAIWSYTNAILTLSLLSLTTAAMLFSLVMYTLLFIDLIKEKNKQTKA